MTQIISPSGQKNNEFSQWDQTKKYRTGDLVIYNSVIYEVGANVAAGTPWGPEWAVAVEGGNASFAEDAQNAVNALSADEALAIDAPDTTAIKIGGGTLGQVLKSLGDGTTEWGDVAGGSGTPGGTNTQVQFNDSGVFGAAPSFTFVADTDTVTVQNLAVTGEINTSLIPSANVTYDLGSTSLRWNDLYLSNSTIYMDDQTISANAGNILFSGNIVAAELVGNATYATSAGEVARDNVTGVTGRDGQLQFNTTSGNLTSNERYFIGANGGGALNISRDGASGTGVAIYAYSNQASIAATFVSRARGTKTAPLAAQVGDRVFSTGGQIYTGVGTATADTITGWTPLSQSPSMAAEITALPTSPSTTYGSKLTFAASNATTNSLRTMTFNDDGSLNVPGDIVAQGALLPTANITYDLGSSTQRWKDLWISNSTIHMGDQTISANATHVTMDNIGATTVEATSLTGDLVRGTTTVAIDGDDGNINFTVGGLQQWQLGTNGALIAANTTAEFLGTSDQAISLRAGGLNIGTIDNLVAGGAVNDFAFVAGNAASGDSPAAGGAITITTGRGGIGLNGNDGGAGGAFIVSTGLGGTCDAGASPGASGEIILTTTDSLPATGVPGVTSGPITITTGNGGDTDTTEAGASGEITIRTGNGGTGGEFAWSRESGDLTLATGNGGDIIPGGTSRDAESAGSIILQGGTGGNSPTRGGGRGGAIELIGGTGGIGGTRGSGGGPITLAAGNGTEGFTEEPGSGGRIEIIAGDAGSSGTIYGGTADGVEIFTGNGGDGVDASSVDHNGGSPRGDGGPLRLRTGNGGSVQLGEPGYGGNIEIEGGKGGDNNADNGGNAGNMTITLGNGGDSSASNGGIGGSFTLTAGNGGTGASSNGTSGSITLTTQAGSLVLDPTGQITLPPVNGEQAVIKGTRTSVIGTISNPVPNTPTVVYAVAARAFKISFTITHTTNTFDLETEFFDVVVARGTTTLFSVSNRLNTFGSGVGGVNDTVVTVDINGTSNEIEVSLTTKIGTAAAVAYSVTEFKN